MTKAEGNEFMIESFDEYFQVQEWEGTAKEHQKQMFYTEDWFKEQTRQMWLMWEKAKAQAVPNAQQALHDRLLVKSIREHVEGHISEISVNDLFDKGWLAAMKCIQNNIDMLELQDPAND